MTKDLNFYYLTLSDFEVYSVNPNDGLEYSSIEFESFTPTLDGIDEGYVVFAKYKTYDSFKTDEHPSYCVIDIYKDKAEAIKNGTIIAELVRDDRWPDPKGKTYGDETAKNADGSEVKYLPFTGWGSSLEEIVIKKVAVKNEYEYTIIRRF